MEMSRHNEMENRLSNCQGVTRSDQEEMEYCGEVTHIPLALPINTIEGYAWSNMAGVSLQWVITPKIFTQK
tara:strand:+ start:1275 stop:1487 length:213 start_codon:yes stop_codon:yes gene_type:complete